MRELGAVTVARAVQAVNAPDLPQCQVPNCDRPAARSNRCWAHSKRFYEGKPVNVDLPPTNMSNLARLLTIAMSVAEADEDRAFELAMDRLRKGALAYAYKLGWRPLKKRCAQCAESGRSHSHS